MAEGEECWVTINVVYDAPTGSRPIIFHSSPFVSWSERLHRRQGDKWEEVEDDDTCFMIVDDPDVVVIVSEHKDFTSLEPGQTLTKKTRLDLQETQVGDVFRYVFKGLVLDWWDWGDREEHRETTVALPCHLGGPVQEPKDNGGRPALVVPSSNTIVFTIV
jgi:hypothetical protein